MTVVYTGGGCEMATSGSVNTCPVCGAMVEGSAVDLGMVPAQSTSLWPDAESARAAPSGRICLMGCGRCGSVFNADFDPELVPYDAQYENSQFFSPRFRAYAEELAARLVRDHGLAGRHVIEVGSGKGEFLAELSRAGVGRATGFDPSYDGEIDALDLPGVVLVRERYGPDVVVDPGAVVCRHVLEHLFDPVGFLTDIRKAMGTAAPVLYLEVPNRAVTFSSSGVWDVIYQHCTYYDARSLSWVARQAGFQVLRCGTAFDDQFLYLEAVPIGRTPGSVAPMEDGAPKVRPPVEEMRALAALDTQVVEEWRRRLGDWSDQGRRVGLWGAGAKGVTFLNLVGGQVGMVIDVNPRKQARFLPGTGHVVSVPKDLVADPVDELVVVNSAYLDEIAHQIDALGVRAELIAL